MPDPSSSPTDPALQAQLPERRLSRVFREPTLPWLRRASQVIRVAVLVVLLLMVVVGWGTFSIWVAYGGVVYLVFVTIAVPFWIAYMFRPGSRRWASSAPPAETSQGRQRSLRNRTDRAATSG